MSKTFNWAIIGPGKIAHKFATSLSALPEAKVFAIGSRSLDRAQAFAKNYSAPYQFGSYEAMVQHKEIDAVYVATPHPFHLENTLLCLEHKIPVLCEKPLAMNRTQVLQMINTAKVNHTFLMEAMWSRFLPSFVKVKALLDAGIIGEVVHLKADFGFKAKKDLQSRIYNKALGGGSILDIGIYPIFLALFLLGKPERIKAMARMSETEIDEDCAMLFHYANGAIAQLHSTITANTANEAYIYGELGYLRLQPRFHESKGVELRLYNGKNKTFHFEYPTFAYYFEAKEVMETIRSGKVESDKMSWQMSLDLMEILDAVRSEVGLTYKWD